MAFTITSQSAASTSIPVITGYSVDRESGNIMHIILGRADPDITLNPLRPRAGTLNCFMGDIDSAHSLVVQFEEEGWQLLESSEAPLTDMYFVLSGTIAMVHDDETETFTVSAEFQEVVV